MSSMKPSLDLCYGCAVRRGFLISAILGLVVTSTAYAAERPKAAVAIAGKMGAKEADALAADLHRALAERPELAVLPDDREAWLFRSTKPPAEKRSKKNLEAAKKLLAEAQEQLNNFDLPGAVKSVTKVKTALAGWIGTKAAFELDRDRLQLTVAIAHAQRDEQRLLSALNEYALRYPSEPPPAGLWPPGVVSSLKSIELGASVLTVKSEPRALVSVDGREVGTSPIRLGALPVGEHRVEIQLPGYWPIDQTLATSGTQEAIVESKLSPNLSSALRKVSLKKSLDAELETRIKELAPELSVLVLAGIEEGKLVVHRIDLGAASAVPPKGAAETVRGEPSNEGVRLAVAQLFSVPDHPSASKDVPLWAWIGAGSGVVAIGAGVTMRMMAVGTQHEFAAKSGGLTQTEAYDFRDRGGFQATSGAILLGLGLAAIAGVAGWVAVDVL